jgi:hypothetical protein
MPSQIRVDSIADLNGTAATELTYGATFPTGSKLTVNGNINLTGVSTVGILSATNAVISGVVTATSFIGNGSQLTGLQSVGPSKSIALKIILDPLPFRS